VTLENPISFEKILLPLQTFSNNPKTVFEEPAVDLEILREHDIVSINCY